MQFFLQLNDLPLLKIIIYMLSECSLQSGFVCFVMDWDPGVSPAIISMLPQISYINLQWEPQKEKLITAFICLLGVIHKWEQKGLIYEWKTWHWKDKLYGIKEPVKTTASRDIQKIPHATLGRPLSGLSLFLYLKANSTWGLLSRQAVGEWR